MTKVFGAGSQEWNEAAIRRSRNPGHRGPRDGADRLCRHRDPLRQPAGCDLRRNPNANNDPLRTRLPDEPGRLHGLQGALRGQVRQPRDQQRLGVRQRHGRSADRRPVRPAGLPGLRRDVREEHARRGRADAGARRPGDLRLHLRRARLPRQLRATSTPRTAPARPATSSSSRTTTRRSASSSRASRTTGSPRTTRSSSFTVEEGDHFAGTAPDAAVRRRHHRCTYANGHVTEVNGDLKRLVATYNASHGTSATTSFSVHSRHGAERLRQRQPGPRLGPRARTSRRRCPT